MKKITEKRLNLQRPMGQHIGYMIISGLLILILFGFFSIDVYSKSIDNQISSNKEHIDMMEKEYLKEMKEVLADYGCNNAGITMVKVYEESSTSYEVKIHHSNLGYLEEKNQKQLKEQLQHLVQDFPKANFLFSFS